VKPSFTQKASAAGFPQSVCPFKQESMREPSTTGEKKFRTEASPAVVARSRIPRVAKVVLNIFSSEIKKAGQEANEAA
jgi:hypothetical protein